MGLRDEIQAYNLKVAGCSVGKLLNNLDKKTSAELTELLDDPMISSAQIGRLSHAKGWNVHEDSFQKHRRGACRCVTPR